MPRKLFSGLRRASRRRKQNPCVLCVFLWRGPTAGATRGLLVVIERATFRARQFLAGDRANKAACIGLLQMRVREPKSAGKRQRDRNQDSPNPLLHGTCLLKNG